MDVSHPSLPAFSLVAPCPSHSPQPRLRDACARTPADTCLLGGAQPPPSEVVMLAVDRAVSLTCKAGRLPSFTGNFTPTFISVPGVTQHREGWGLHSGVSLPGSKPFALHPAASSCLHSVCRA